jgi:hypothetical protein
MRIQFSKRSRLALAFATGAAVLMPAAAFGADGCGDYSISLKLGSTAIPAGNTTTATASVLHNGQPDPLERVFFETSGAGTSVSTDSVGPPATGPGLGDYQVTIKTDGASIGPAKVNALFFPTRVGCQSLVQGLTIFGAPTRVLLSLAPNPAHIGSAVVGTATLTDALNQRVPGNTVTFTTTGDDTFGSPAILATKSATGTDNKDGTYSVDLNVSNSPGRQLIIATASNGKRGTATLTQFGGLPVRCVVSATPGSVPADGTSKANVSATLYDSADNPVPGQSVTFDANDPDITFSANPVTSNNDGVASTTLTASRSAGSKTISAFAGNIGCSTNFAES